MLRTSRVVDWWYLTCSLDCISRVHTSRRRSREIPHYKDTPRFRTDRPYTGRCWSTSYPQSQDIWSNCARSIQDNKSGPTKMLRYYELINMDYSLLLWKPTNEESRYLCCFQTIHTAARHIFWLFFDSFTVSTIRLHVFRELSLYL